MSSDNPDFRSYSTKELREVLGFIDREKFPERVEEVLSILAEREHAKLFEPDEDHIDHEARVPPEVQVAGTSVKRGRSYSLFGGVWSVVAGVLWILAMPSMFARQAEPAPLPFQLLFYAAGVGAVLSGLVNIYNAFARNRFSEFDAVSTDDEPDPLSSLLEPSSDED